MLVYAKFIVNLSLRDSKTFASLQAFSRLSCGSFLITCLGSYSSCWRSQSLMSPCFWHSLLISWHLSFWIWRNCGGHQPCHSCAPGNWSRTSFQIEAGAGSRRGTSSRHWLWMLRLRGSSVRDFHLWVLHCTISSKDWLSGWSPQSSVLWSFWIHGRIIISPRIISLEKRQ